MSEPLSATDLERMRAEHVPGQWDTQQICNGCSVEPAEYLVLWPCDAALLLAELGRREPRQGLTIEEAKATAQIQWTTQTEWAAKLEAQGYTKERDGVYSKPRPEFGAAGIAYGLCGPTTTEELTS